MSPTDRTIPRPPVSPETKPFLGRGRCRHTAGQAVHGVP